MAIVSSILQLRLRLRLHNCLVQLEMPAQCVSPDELHQSQAKRVSAVISLLVAIYQSRLLLPPLPSFSTHALRLRG